MSERDRVFRLIAWSLVGLLVLALIVTGIVMMLVQGGYLSLSPAPEPELTPQERFTSEFREGEITVTAKLVEAKTFCPFFVEPCSEPFIAEFDWQVEEYNSHPKIIYNTFTQDPDFIAVLELLVANIADYRGLEFAVTLYQKDCHFGADTVYVHGTLIRIKRESEDGYRWWQPFTFQPSLELVEEVLAETTFDDPQLADWERLQLKTVKKAYSRMVEYAQQGKLLRVYELRVKITHALLDRALEDASVIPLCREGYRCDYTILERNDDNSLKLYLVEEREVAEEAVRTLRYRYQEVADLIEGVEILSLTDYDEELDVNWTSYNLAIRINGVWFSVRPGKDIQVIHWLF